MKLHLAWSKDCGVSKILSNAEVPPHPAANLPIANLPEWSTTDATFEKNSTKLYVPAITLSMNDVTKCLENTKQRLKRTFYRDKYKSDITTQSKNKNLDYKIDPIFSNIN